MMGSIPDLRDFQVCIIGDFLMNENRKFGGKDLSLSIVILRFCLEATYVRRTLNFGTKQFVEGVKCLSCSCVLG